MDGAGLDPSGPSIYEMNEVCNVGDFVLVLGQDPLHFGQGWDLDREL